MTVTRLPGVLATPDWLCARCGLPADAQHFDESGFADVPVVRDGSPPRDRLAPPVGTSVTLARFELPPQYCGILEYVFQFTNLHARRPDAVVTPDLEWAVLCNGRPLSPFVRVNRILNPWGVGCCPVATRLEEGATVEMTVRFTGVRLTDLSVRGLAVQRIGGRITGRYWYNHDAYGRADVRPLTSRRSP